GIRTRRCCSGAPCAPGRARLARHAPACSSRECRAPRSPWESRSPRPSRRRGSRSREREGSPRRRTRGTHTARAPPRLRYIALARAYGRDRARGCGRGQSGLYSRALLRDRARQHTWIRVPSFPAPFPDGASAPRCTGCPGTGAPLPVHSACPDLAAGLADRTRMPVTLASIPACCLEALRPTLGRARESRIRDYAPAPPPAPMSAAPFLLREDGRPDWGAMWGSFCELALYGGRPPPGARDPPRAPAAQRGEPRS